MSAKSAADATPADGLLLREFMAEHEPIQVQPVVRMPAIRLVTGAYGPFYPLERARVPLWMGLMLKAKGKCSIVPPDWMDSSFLEEKIEKEKSFGVFSALPYYYLEVGFLILDRYVCRADLVEMRLVLTDSSASDDVPRSEDVRRLLCDLQVIRGSKIRSGLGGMDGEYLQVNSMGSMEIESNRSIFCSASDILRDLKS